MPRKRPIEVPEGEAADRWRRAAFVEWMRIRNLAPQTIKGYRSDVGQFIRWCEERSIAGPEEVTRSHMQRYQRWLYHYRIPESGERAERPLTFETQLAKLTAIRTYFQFFVKRGFLDLNPATDLELPKQGKRLPKAILKPEEVQAIFAACDLESKVGLRDRAIFEVFYSTGIRRFELSNLRVLDIDLDGGTAMVRQGKGLKDRVVPLGDRALHWVAKYMLESRPKLVFYKDPSHLFLTRDGKQIEPDTLTILVKKYLKKAGLDEIEGGCHLFRHACATHMLEGGADIRYIQELLGHAYAHTTQRYTRVSIRKLKEVHAKTHPAEQAHRRPKADESDDEAARAAFLAELAGDGED